MGTEAQINRRVRLCHERKDDLMWRQKVKPLPGIDKNEKLRLFQPQYKNRKLRRLEKSCGFNDQKI